MTRTYRDAHAIARRNPDRIAASKLLCGLLWHVEASNGGFIGLSDAELEAKCDADPCLSYAAAVSWQWAPPEWPTEQSQTERKAA